jgi:hypothetical protein
VVAHCKNCPVKKLPQDKREEVTSAAASTGIKKRLNIHYVRLQQAMSSDLPYAADVVIPISYDELEVYYIAWVCVVPY